MYEGIVTKDRSSLLNFIHNVTMQIKASFGDFGSQQGMYSLFLRC